MKIQLGSWEGVSVEDHRPFPCYDNNDKLKDAISRARIWIAGIETSAQHFSPTRWFALLVGIKEHTPVARKPSSSIVPPHGSVNLVAS